MIRELAIGSILLIAQAVPAFAEIVPLACTSDRITIHIVFDTDARTVTETDNHTYPMQMTDLQVTWQWQAQEPTPVLSSATYNRNSGQLTESHAAGSGSSGIFWGAGNANYTCVRGQKPF
jgi:hypothetical protein